MKWTSAAAWMGRRVLVTGASGFLGRAVSLCLVEAGAEVHGTWRSRFPEDEVLGHPCTLPVDARDLIEAIAPDVIIHLAAPATPGAPAKDYRRLREGILDATAAVASAAEARGCRLLHVGTCAEYGESPHAFTEADPGRPTSPYGALKLAATEWVMSRVRSGALIGGVVRPFRAFGPHDDSSVVALACRAAVAGEPFPMTSGEQVREWNHVEPMAQHIVAAAAHPGALGHILNLGGGPSCSVIALVRRVFELADAPAELIQAGSLAQREGAIAELRGDHRARRALWPDPPALALDDALRDTLAWHRR